MFRKVIDKQLNYLEEKIMYILHYGGLRKIILPIILFNLCNLITEVFYLNLLSIKITGKIYQEIKHKRRIRLHTSFAHCFLCFKKIASINKIKKIQYLLLAK